jgi:two-component system sensor histidine kinase HydH
MHDAMNGRLRWWGLAAGALGGVLDTALFLRLGIDLQVAGRDVTLPFALYLATSFACLGYAIGYLADARQRARRDAEQIRRQLRELEATRRVASQNEKLAAIGRLAAGVAHEVRNPLGVIRASAAMVQEGFEPQDEAHRACQFICEEIDRLNGLISSLLAFARPHEPRLSSVSLEKVVDRALQLAGDELARRAVAIERHTAGPVPLVSADPDLLAQVVLGLVTNACEALGRGGRVLVRLEADPDEVRLEVADDGPGVALEDAARVFEPFFTTKPSGTGLGLAMAARIVDGHRGQLESVPGAGAGAQGRGACFRVSLPVADADRASRVIP